MPKKNLLRPSILLAASLIFPPIACLADPLVTITCDPPKGTTQEYGVTGADRVKAANDHKPEPVNHFTGPSQDGYNGKPVFIVDSSRKKLTMLWADLASEKAREIQVIAYSPELITALDAHPGPNGLVALYSFYPRLGIVFWSQHYTSFDGGAADQSAFFAKCQFSWSGHP